MIGLDDDVHEQRAPTRDRERACRGDRVPRATYVRPRARTAENSRQGFRLAAHRFRLASERLRARTRPENRLVRGEIASEHRDQNNGSVGPRHIGGRADAPRTVGKILRRALNKTKGHLKDTRVGPRLTREELVKAAKAGDDVVADSIHEAEDIARRAGEGRRPVHHRPQGPGKEAGLKPHYHVAGPGGKQLPGHVFYEVVPPTTIWDDLVETAKDIFDLFVPPAEELMPPPVARP